MSALTAFATAKSTFFDVVTGHAERNPDQPALVALGFAPISYRDLLIQTGKIWDSLRDAGVKYGSQIGIALPSGPEIGNHDDCNCRTRHVRAFQPSSFAKRVRARTKAF